MFPHQLLPLEVSEHFSRTAWPTVTSVRHVPSLRLSGTVFILHILPHAVINMLTHVRLPVLVLTFKTISSGRRMTARGGGYTSPCWSWVRAGQGKEGN